VMFGGDRLRTAGREDSVSFNLKMTIAFE